VYLAPIIQIWAGPVGKLARITRRNLTASNETRLPIQHSDRRVLFPAGGAQGLAFDSWLIDRSRLGKSFASSLESLNPGWELSHQNSSVISGFGGAETAIAGGVSLVDADRSRSRDDDLDGGFWVPNNAFRPQQNTCPILSNTRPFPRLVKAKAKSLVSAGAAVRTTGTSQIRTTGPTHQRSDRRSTLQGIQCR
jgi:hypothetical protein